jgi:hypothetical protein
MPARYLLLSRVDARMSDTWQDYLGSLLRWSLLNHSLRVFYLVETLKLIQV